MGGAWLSLRQESGELVLSLGDTGRSVSKKPPNQSNNNNNNNNNNV
jgi:hypothetical protein